MGLRETKCKRCGKELTAAARTITGADGAWLGDVCSSCVTPEEEYMILRMQGEAILAKNIANLVCQRVECPAIIKKGARKQG